MKVVAGNKLKKSFYRLYYAYNIQLFLESKCMDTMLVVRLTDACLVQRTKAKIAPQKHYYHMCLYESFDIINRVFIKYIYIYFAVFD